MKFETFWIARLIASRGSVTAIAVGADELVLERKGSPKLTIGFSELDSDVSLRKGKLFCQLHVESTPYNGTLKWIGASRAAALDSVFETIKNHRIQEYTLAQKSLRLRLTALLPQLEKASASHYIRSSHVNVWLANVELQLGTYRALDQARLSTDFHELAKQLATDAARVSEIVKGLNSQFVATQLLQYKALFDSVEKNPLTDSQRKAVVMDADATLVLAGAGSGKTSVLVAKVAYLLESGRAKPEEIIVLAFNTKAAAEIDERIKERVSNAVGMKAQTFHAFGRSVVGRYRNRMPDISDTTESDSAFQQLIEKLFQDKTVSDQSYATMVLRYFIEYLYQRVSPIDLESGEYAERLKAADLRTAKGELVKSTEERIIADFLFVNRVEYTYEARYEFDTATEVYRQYRPDFFLRESRIYIEHFALSKAESPPPKWPEAERTKYTAGVVWKRELHRKMGTKLIETYSHQQSDGVLTDVLGTSLAANGVTLSPMTFAEFQQAVLDVGEDYPTASRMADLIAKCISLHKSSARNEDELRATAARFPDCPRAQAFLDVYLPMYEGYAQELKDRGEIDFNDMILEASLALNSGTVNVGFKYVLVDEFQDLSGARRILLDAIRQCVPTSVLYCVGDDWQSIYSFAGSDVSLTTKFVKEYAGGEIAKIRETFRYGNRLLEVSSRFVQKNPGQLQKSVVSALGFEKHVPIKIVLYTESSQEAVSFSANDIASNFSESSKVYLLGRYTHSATRESLSRVQKCLGTRINAESMTVHKSKGMEADVVVLNEANMAFRLGFPSRVREDPLLQLFRPAPESYPDAEERRLFYVAMTRAKQCVYITAKETEASPFIHELISNPKSSPHIEILHANGGKAVIELPCTCARCERGTLVQKVGATGISYFRCTLLPYCEGFYRACKYCGRSPMLPTGGVLQCQSKACGKALTICPGCGDGYMVKRKGPHGQFLGCSNFAKEDCKHKIRMDAAARRGVQYLA